MIKIVEKKEDANCITHNGTMHADDVFATAFLEMYLKDVHVFRTSSINPNTISKDVFVYDVGRGKYDHHQIGALKEIMVFPTVLLDFFGKILVGTF